MARALRCRRVVALIATLMLAPAVHAHGGVAVEDDKCIMTIGPYSAHFTGYQPEVRASQEFCEDIPAVAKSIVVLDFISRPLREMAIDFRVLRDVKNLGVSATYADLGSADEIQQATMFYVPAATYPRGSIDVTVSFDEPGHFIGVLTAVDDKTDTRREYVSVFPFSVGVTNWWARLKWIVISALLGVGLLVWASRSNKAVKAPT